MAKSIILNGASIKLFINNKTYNVAQSINLTVDYAETEIYGIDAPYPQELATQRVSVRGSVSGVRVKYSGGLQGSNMRPLFNDIAASPYISIRIQDRSTGEDIAFVPNAKVTRETHTVATKSVYRLNFDFVGQMVLWALDRAK